MWTVWQKIVEPEFEAREGRNIVLLDFLHVEISSCCLQVKSKWRRNN